MSAAILGIVLIFGSALLVYSWIGWSVFKEIRRMDFDGKPWQRLTSLVKTCDACPSQWDGVTEDGRQVYIRYRFDHLTVEMEKAPSDIPYVDAPRDSWETVYADDAGDDGWGGFMDEETLRKLTGIRVV
jgi:hypothetical protein